MHDLKKIFRTNRISRFASRANVLRVRVRSMGKMMIVDFEMQALVLGHESAVAQMSVHICYMYRMQIAVGRLRQ